jgi:hypothetical protein
MSSRYFLHAQFRVDGDNVFTRVSNSNYHGFESIEYYFLSCILYFSMMDMTGLLSSCQSAMLKWYCLSKIVTKLPSMLVVSLCGGMLWQCSTCLLKYFDRPTQASIFYDSIMGPVSITVCLKGNEGDYNYTFPELDAVDTREQTGAGWITAWAAKYNEFTTDATANNFIFSNIQNKLQLCKNIQVKGSSISDLRIRHHSSETCKLNRIKVYLHSQGLFHAWDFSVALDKNLFSSEKNYTLALAMETIQSLKTPDFNCSEYNIGQTLDSCLVAEAMQAANSTAGCIFQYDG